MGKCRDLLEQFAVINEEVDVNKVINDLINAEPSDDNSEQGKIVSLLKGLAFSDDKDATEFVKRLTDLMNKENFGDLAK